MTHTWAIVPIKPFYSSKSRLAGVLSSDERAALSQEMLEHTLAVLTQVESVHGALVVSRDPAALAIAREYDANTVQESGSPELNVALERATTVVTTWGAKRVLVLPSDLPLLTQEDVIGLLANGQYPRQVVIAPDRREEGTNALVMKPPDLMEVAFGNGSFAEHIHRAEAVGAHVREYRSPTVALDVDLPEDLELYREKVAAD